MRKRWVRIAAASVLLVGMIFVGWSFVNRGPWVEVANGSDADMLDVRVSLPSGEVVFDRIARGSTARQTVVASKVVDPEVMPAIRVAFHRPGEPKTDGPRLEYRVVSPRWLRLDLTASPDGSPDHYVTCRPTFGPPLGFRHVYQSLLALRDPFTGRLPTVSMTVD